MATNLSSLISPFILGVNNFPKKGITFRDIAPLLANHEAMKALLAELKTTWHGKVTKVGGFDARGFIFGALLAYELHVPFFMLRKKGKLPGDCIQVSYALEYGEAVLEVQEDAIQAGDTVLLVDDLLATGGTAYAGCKLVEQLGGTVAGVQCIIELDGLGGKEKLSPYIVESVIHF